MNNHYLPQVFHEQISLVESRMKKQKRPADKVNDFVCLVTKRVRFIIEIPARTFMKPIEFYKIISDNNNDIQKIRLSISSSVMT